MILNESWNDRIFLFSVSIHDLPPKKPSCMMMLNLLFKKNPELNLIKITYHFNKRSELKERHNRISLFIDIITWCYPSIVCRCCDVRLLTFKRIKNTDSLCLLFLWSDGNKMLMWFSYESWMIMLWYDDVVRLVCSGSVSDGVDDDFLELCVFYDIYKTWMLWWYVAQIVEFVMKKL